MASNPGQGSAGGAKGILDQINNGIKRLAATLSSMLNRKKS